jgi:hypothetical protein
VLRLAARLAEPISQPELLAPLAYTTISMAHGAVPRDVDLRAFDTISGGAIVQAALDVLLRIGSVRGRGRVIEREPFELSNTNRYQLNRIRDIGEPKIAGIVQAARATLALAGVPQLLLPETLRELLPLERKVLVGVDNVPGRWLAQAQDPEWLAVGATADFLAMASEHTSETPCAGCVHTVDDGVREVIPTISFVSYWSGLLLATRLIAHATEGVTVPRDRVTEMNALRLDSRVGIRQAIMAASLKCPIHCRASQRISNLA